MGDTVRMAVVGCGRIAQTAHLPAIEKASGVELAAVCDASPALAEAAGSRYAVPWTTDLDAVLTDPEVEAVVVAVPDRLHLTVAESALAAGKHVLVEKPMATNADECQRLVKLAVAAGLKLQVGAMKRHDPGIEFARQFVQAQLGPVISFSAWYCVDTLRPEVEATLFPPMAVDPSVRRQEATFKADRSSYLLSTHGAHVFDGIRFLLGDVANVQAHLSIVDDDYCWQGLLRMVSGAVGRFELTVNVHSEWSEGYAIHGRHGSVQVRSFFPFFRRASAVRAYREADRAWIEPAFGDSDPYERQLESLAEAIRTDGPTSPDAADGLAAVELISAVAQSVHTGRSIAP